MIKTACASDFNKKNPRPPNSGTVILITRGPPYKWLDYDEYIHILSPEQNTKNRWMGSRKTEKDWIIYLSEFNPQMKEERPVKKIEELRQRVNNGETITLLCYCKIGVHCHRDIIKSMIER